MSELVVTGYASLDYVLRLDGDIAPGRTTHAHRDESAWPRHGGCPSYIALAVVASGQTAAPVMWLGDDAEAHDQIAHLEAEGVSTHSIAQVTGARSPSAVMVYDARGDCSCLYDPGLENREALNPAQKSAIAGANYLCISVGPGSLTERILELRRPGTRLYWALKDDPSCFTKAIRTRLSEEADVIFCSASERELIGSTNAIIVQTQGATGVRVEVGGNIINLPVAPISANDTTGAGDTFAGGFIAAEMAGEATPEQAVQAGIRAASQLLQDRQGEVHDKDSVVSGT